MARSAAARQGIAGWPEDEVDGLIAALAGQVAGQAEELAAATVAETGIGCVPDKAARTAFDERDGRLRRTVLGQAAASIAAQAGIEVPAGTRLLVAPLPRQAVPGPYGREKLAPILSLFTAQEEDDGIRLCRQILGHGGSGHTAIIHTRSDRLQLSFSQQMPVSRILVNSPDAQGCIGLGTGLTPFLTLGCGTYGRTSTTDNVTYTNLVNIKRMAHPLPGASDPPPPSPKANRDPGASAAGEEGMPFTRAAAGRRGG